MFLKKRILSLTLCVLIALVPALSTAESMSSYFAGELTRTVVSDSYAAGNQVNMTLTFDLNVEDALNSDRVRALASLIGKSQVNLSFYDDAGTACISAELVTDGVKLLTMNALVYEDGSVQAMTNLTGKLVLALPAGTISPGSISLESLMYGSDMQVEEGVEFKDLPAFDRLRMTAADVSVMIFSHLLGWVSETQRGSGELYVFDDTYIEPTQTRDGVAQRMIGTIQANEFNTLLYNIAATLCDQYGDFQQALADCLAELGVTRAQVRTVVDALLTEETIDPALDWVEPSYYIVNEPDGSLCEYDDVSYFFKKLFKSADKIWSESLDTTLSLIVSYDDYGNTVGFDAVLPQFTENLPYEGSFTYSLKTDDNWQSLHTAHGELQIFDNQRIVGDLKRLDGEDVNNVNSNFLNGSIDLVDQNTGSSVGLGLDSALDYEVSVNEENEDVESFTGSASLSLRENGTGAQALSATIDGETTTDGESFALNAAVSLKADGLAQMDMSVTLEPGEAEEMAFTGGQAIDLTKLDETQLETVKNEVFSQGVGISMSLITHPGVLSDLMTLISQ